MREDSRSDGKIKFPREAYLGDNIPEFLDVPFDALNTTRAYYLDLMNVEIPADEVVLVKAHKDRRTEVRGHLETIRRRWEEFLGIFAEYTAILDTAHKRGTLITADQVRNEALRMKVVRTAIEHLRSIVMTSGEEGGFASTVSRRFNSALGGFEGGAITLLDNWQMSSSAGKYIQPDERDIYEVCNLGEDEARAELMALSAQCDVMIPRLLSLVRTLRANPDKIERSDLSTELTDIERRLAMPAEAAQAWVASLIDSEPADAASVGTVLPEGHRVVKRGQEVVMVANVGGSSVKMEVLNAKGEVIAAGKTEEANIGDKGCVFRMKINRPDGTVDEVTIKDIERHSDAYEAFVRTIKPHTDYGKAIQAVLYKTVQGGPRRQGTVVLDDATLKAMGKTFVALAPDHNPLYVQAAKALKKLLPAAVHIGRFETATHVDLLPEAATPSIPRPLAESLGLGRLPGFHGASFAHLLRETPRRVRGNKYVFFHLGSSISYAAARGGRLIDTSFKGTPESGATQQKRTTGANLNVQIFEFMVQAIHNLLDRYYHNEIFQADCFMKARAANYARRIVRSLAQNGRIKGKKIDYEAEMERRYREGELGQNPAPRYVGAHKAIREELMKVFKSKSGLMGIAGIGTGDIKKIKEARDEGNHMAKLAYDILVYEARGWLGKAMMSLGGDIDAIVFTAGTGENDPEFRRRVIGDGRFFKTKLAREHSRLIKLSRSRNNRMVGGAEGLITSDDSPVKVLVLQADETATLLRDGLKKYREVLSEAAGTGDEEHRAAVAEVAPEVLAAARDAYKYIGVSMGGNKVAVSINDGHNNILAYRELRWDTDPRFDNGQIKEHSSEKVQQVMEAVEAMILEVVEENGADRSKIKTLSCAFAGDVDEETGRFSVILPAQNLPFDDYPFADEFSERMRAYQIDFTLVTVGNDAKWSQRGEKFAPEGWLRDVIDGSIMIDGGGTNIYPPDKIEAGHNLIQVTGRDGKIHYALVFEGTKGGHPIERGAPDARIIDKCGDIGEEYVAGPAAFTRAHPEYPFIEYAEGMRDLEDRVSGPSIRARLEETIEAARKTSSGDLPHYEAIERAAAALEDYPGELERVLTQEAASGNPVAIAWIKDVGREIGQALAAFIDAYQDEEFVKRIVLVSGICENLGKDVYDTDAAIEDTQQGNDIFMKAVREAAGQELVNYFDMDLNQAREITAQIVRSNMDYRRELTAHQPTDKEVLAVYDAEEAAGTDKDWGRRPTDWSRVTGGKSISAATTRAGSAVTAKKGDLQTARKLVRESGYRRVFDQSKYHILTAQAVLGDASNPGIGIVIALDQRNIFVIAENAIQAARLERLGIQNIVRGRDNDLHDALSIAVRQISDINRRDGNRRSVRITYTNNENINLQGLDLDEVYREFDFEEERVDLSNVRAHDVLTRLLNEYDIRVTDPDVAIRAMRMTHETVGSGA